MLNCRITVSGSKGGIERTGILHANCPASAPAGCRAAAGAPSRHDDIAVQAQELEADLSLALPVVLAFAFLARGGAVDIRVEHSLALLRLGRMQGVASAVGVATTGPTCDAKCLPTRVEVTLTGSPSHSCARWPPPGPAGVGAAARFEVDVGVRVVTRLRETGAVDCDPGRGAPGPASAAPTSVHSQRLVTFQSISV